MEYIINLNRSYKAYEKLQPKPKRYRPGPC